MKQVQKGFTLIELMIVVAIIGILAAVAIPAYSNYTKKAKFTEVVQATQAIKTGIEACQADMGALQSCWAGTNGVPNAINSATVTQATTIEPVGPTNWTLPAAPTQGNVTTPTFGKYVDYIVTYVDDSSHIAIVAAAAKANGLEGQTYVLQGRVSARGMEWSLNQDPAVSTCVRDSICK